MLERIFLLHKLCEKLKTYVENISELIIQGKFRYCQFSGIDTAEILVPFNNDEFGRLLEESKPWQRVCSILKRV